MISDSPASNANLRIALIGPVFPYRGGIAQYTTELSRALHPGCRLRTISFSRQYPAWLYPGKSDREPGTEDASEPDVEYLLDGINPLTWLSTARSISERGCDLAIINWWTLFWAPAFAIIAHMLRKRGVPVLFICHNLFDHDSGLIKRALSARLLAPANAYLVHAKALAARLHAMFPDKPVLTHPHPTHDRFPPVATKLPKRGRLELLFFGFIRPYKGLDTLIDALAKLGDKEIFLTVVGEPWCPPNELRSSVEASGAPNIELHLDYVDAVQAANFFERADLVVLPYRAATGSAVAAVAYRYERPLLATRVGGLPDVIEEGNTGFLIDPDSPEALAERLRTLHRSALENMHQNICVYKQRFTWTSLADTLLGFVNPPYMR